MSPAEIEEFFSRLAALNPEPKTELYYTNSYTLLVAVILSAQATDKGVNKVTQYLFQEVDTPKKMVALGEEALYQRIKSINFGRTKAKSIINTSHQLLARFGGEVPRRREDLETLPGVGRKTANVVLNVAFGEPTMAVDTHIFRVCNRTGLAPGATPLQVELGLLERVPSRWLLHAHHWLILHGRYICKARHPECGHCPVYAVCHYPQKTA